jgi:hypothetical protein
MFQELAEEPLGQTPRESVNVAPAPAPVFPEPVAPVPAPVCLPVQTPVMGLFQQAPCLQPVAIMQGAQQAAASAAALDAGLHQGKAALTCGPPVRRRKTQEEIEAQIERTKKRRR